MPAAAFDLSSENRLEVGALYRRELYFYQSAPAGQTVAKVQLRVDGVWEISYVDSDSVVQVAELTGDPGHANGSAVYVRQDGEDGPWLIVSAALPEDLSAYTGVALQVRVQRDQTSTVVIEFSSDPGEGITFQPNALPQITIERVIPENVTPGNWYYDVKLLGLKPRRVIEGRARITNEVTTDG